MNTEVENKQPCIKNAFGFHDPLKKLRPKVSDNLLDGIDGKKASNNYQAEGNGSQWNPRLKRKLESDITDGGSNLQERPRTDQSNVRDNQQTFGSAYLEGQIGSNLVDKSKRQDIFSGSTVVFNDLERFTQYFLNQGSNFDGNGQMISPDEKSVKKNAANDSEDWPDIGPQKSVSDWLNESCNQVTNTDSSDSGSERDSSGSSVDSFLLEEDPPLAEIPLTAKEKRLIVSFMRR